MNKMKRDETKAYVNWVKAEIMRDKRQFEGYFGNKGITGARLRYLDWLASKEGKKGMKAGGEDETKGMKTFGRTTIVPVAILGCGMSSFFFFAQKADLSKVKHRSLSPSSIFLVSDTLRTTM